MVTQRGSTTMTRSYNNNNHNHSNSSLRDDPGALLARGYTARYLGGVLKQHHAAAGATPATMSVTPLTVDEMERDLRHMNAYAEAATRYHQLTYATTNRLPLGGGGVGAAAHPSQHSPTTVSALSLSSSRPDGSTIHPTTATTAAATTTTYSLSVLPVTIDPEEEKRAWQQRKRIQRAEGIREELEQHYVALRAHYVSTTQQLQQEQHDATQQWQFLQNAVVQPAGQRLGLHRARLQMMRDMAAALAYRLERVVGESNSSSTTTPMILVEPPTTIETDPLLATWTQTEEELKQLYHTILPGGDSKSGGNKPSSSQSTTTDPPVPWTSTTQPATAYGTSQLVSVGSTAPEKSLAVSTNGAFGASPHSLQWLERHLSSSWWSSSTITTSQDDATTVPHNDDDDDDAVVHHENDKEGGNHANEDRQRNAQLEREVQMLQQELAKEREANQILLTQTGHTRTLHDEWVAMIALVRQETESVLHRHNILLESDAVQEAVEMAAAAEHEHDDEEEEDDVQEEQVLDDGERHDEEGEEGEVPAPDGATTANVTQEDDSIIGDKQLSMSPTQESGISGAPAPPPPLDEAADADDEGLDADDDDNASNNNKNDWNSKRAPEPESSDSSPGRSSKRRKQL